MTDKTVHQGRNLKRIREILGVKQDVLAFEMGDDWNQQKISLLEQKEELDPKVLEQVAKILKVTPDAIKDFNEESAINIIANTFNDHSVGVNFYPSFNPIDKIVQLYEEKIALYERMLKEKEEMLARFSGRIKE